LFKLEEIHSLDWLTYKFNEWRNINSFYLSQELCSQRLCRYHIYLIILRNCLYQICELFGLLLFLCFRVHKLKIERRKDICRLYSSRVWCCFYISLQNLNLRCSFFPCVVHKLGTECLHLSSVVLHSCRHHKAHLNPFQRKSRLQLSSSLLLMFSLFRVSNKLLLLLNVRRALSLYLVISNSIRKNFHFEAITCDLRKFIKHFVNLVSESSRK